MDVPDVPVVVINKKSQRRVLIWDDLSTTEQHFINRNRRAMSLQPRPLTATWDVVRLPERTEVENVPDWQDA